MSNLPAMMFLLGMSFGMLVQKYEIGVPQLLPPLKRIVVRRGAPVTSPTAPSLSAEEEATETFIQAMWDATDDDLRLKNYKPVKVRRAAPLAITAKPSTTADSMKRIKEFMDDHGVHDMPHEPVNLVGVASRARRSIR